jgi:hypothetical protein
VKALGKGTPSWLGTKAHRGKVCTSTKIDIHEK